MKRVIIVSLATALVALVACKKDDAAQQPTTPQGYQQYPQQPGTYPQQGYPQGAQTGYPQQGYPQPGQTAYPQGTAAPTTPAAGQLATPGPLALPCTSDSACGLAHCNVQYQKCAFPCVSNNDCVQGAACNAMTGFCLPGGQ